MKIHSVMVSRTAKEFYNQFNALLATTEQGKPFNVDAWELMPLRGVAFVGNWCKHGSVIGDIIFPIDYEKTLVIDHRYDHILTRMWRRFMPSFVPVEFCYTGRRPKDDADPLFKNDYADLLFTEYHRADLVEAKDYKWLYSRAVKRGDWGAALHCLNGLIKMRLGYYVYKQIATERDITLMKEVYRNEKAQPVETDTAD